MLLLRPGAKPQSLSSISPFKKLISFARIVLACGRGRLRKKVVIAFISAAARARARMRFRKTVTDAPASCSLRLRDREPSEAGRDPYRGSTSSTSRSCSRLRCARGRCDFRKNLILNRLCPRARPRPRACPLRFPKIIFLKSSLSSCSPSSSRSPMRKRKCETAKLTNADANYSDCVCACLPRPRSRPP